MELLVEFKSFKGLVPKLARGFILLTVYCCISVTFHLFEVSFAYCFHPITFPSQAFGTTQVKLANCVSPERLVEETFAVVLQLPPVPFTSRVA